MSDKCQISSVDLIFSLLSLLVIFSIIFLGWSFIEQKNIEDNLYHELDFIALYSAKSLVDTPGNPGNWHTLGDNYTLQSKSIGLSTIPGIISLDKFDFLVSESFSSYDGMKKILGVLGPGYEIYVELKVYDSFLYSNYGSFGRFPTTDEVSKITRLALTDQGDWAKLDVFIWKDDI